MKKIMEQIKQESFKDELQKIALSMATMKSAVGAARGKMLQSSTGPSAMKRIANRYFNISEGLIGRNIRKDVKSGFAGMKKSFTGPVNFPF